MSHELRKIEDERKAKQKVSDQELRQIGLKVDKLDLKFDSIVDKISILEESHQGGENTQEISELKSQFI